MTDENLSSHLAELDLSRTRLVDHSVMEKLHDLEKEFAAAGKRLSVIGLDAHTPLADHPHAARKSGRHTVATTRETAGSGTGMPD